MSMARRYPNRWQHIFCEIRFIPKIGEGIPDLRQRNMCYGQFSRIGRRKSKGRSRMPILVIERGVAQRADAHAGDRIRA